MKLLEKYESLPAEKQIRIKRFGTIVGIVTLLLIFYYATGRDEKVTAPPPVEKDISLGEGLLKDDITANVDVKMAEFAQQLKDLSDKQISDQTTNENRNQEILSAIEKLNVAVSQLGGQVTSTPTIDGEELPSMMGPDGVSYPPSPNTPTNSTGFQTQEVAPVQMVGKIGHTPGAAVSDEKKKLTVRLYPGFMEGTLLTGIEADALGGASGEPEPIMIRIDTPAVLPNRIKADLVGCFVTASATGKINKERVEARLLGLFCVRQDGRGAVEGEIKGYVADQDGKKGMGGIVISKAGPLVLRASVAGAVMGAGEAFEQTASTNSITGSGLVTSIDEDKIGRAAVGSGVARGAEQFNDIFIEYIKQTTPIIEVGTNKKITVCITEPAELKIVDDTQFQEIGKRNE